MTTEELTFFDDEVEELAEAEVIEVNNLKGIIGRECACIQSIVDKYREVRAWALTLSEMIASAETMVDIIRWGVEYSTTNLYLRMLKYAIFVIDPTRLCFMDGGAVDDCYDITSQSMVVDVDGIKEVVPSGPEYYGEFYRYKNEWQLIATDANHEIKELREEFYANEKPNTWVNSNPYGENTHWIYNSPPREDLYVPKGGWGPNVEEILFWVWRHQEKKLETQRDKTIPVYMSVCEIHRLTGKWEKDGKVTKEAHVVHHIIPPTIRWMESHGILTVRKTDGKWNVTPNITKGEYHLSNVDLEDNFNLVPRRDKYLPIKYQRAGAWFPRVGIIFNIRKIPLFVDEKWHPKQKWERVLTDTTIEEHFVTGGIPFEGSQQLSPELHTDYDRSRTFSYTPQFGKTLKNTFLKKLARGSVKTCVKSETKEHKEWRYNKEKDEWKKVVVKTTIKYTRQAYWVCKIPKGSFLKRFPDEKKRNVYIVLFADIIGEPYIKRVVGYR